MPDPLSLLKQVGKKEKRERDYLLREFYELKKVLELIQSAEIHLKKKEGRKLGNDINDLASFWRREERIERRMARAYQQAENLIEEVEPFFKNEVEVQKIKLLLEQCKVYDADLKKIESRGGEVENLLNEVKELYRDENKNADKILQQLNGAFLLIPRCFKDITAFEKIINDLVNLDLQLYKKAKLHSPEFISSELKKMAAADQATRADQLLHKIWWKWLKGGLKSSYKEMNTEEVDRYNITRLKKILEMVPLKNITNMSDLKRVFIIVLHADHDIAFQETMLQQFKIHPLAGKIKKETAMIIDRIKVNERQPQIFGTQGRQFGQIWAVLPISKVPLGTLSYDGGLAYGEIQPQYLAIINIERRKNNLIDLEKYVRGMEKDFVGTVSGKVYMWKDFSVM